MGARLSSLVAAMTVLVVFGCRPGRYESVKWLRDDAAAWVQRSALSLEGDALATILGGGAQVVALGESAHGARDVFIVRAGSTRRLIEEGSASMIALESDAWGTCLMDAFVRGESVTLDEALMEMPLLYSHEDSREFFGWLRDHNKVAAAPVSVVGIDVQTLDACGEESRVKCSRSAEKCERAKIVVNAGAVESVGVRDEMMARNLLDEAASTDQLVIAWVHAGHAAKSPPLLFNGVRKGGATMGWFIVNELGAEYRAVDISFLEGIVSVNEMGHSLLRPSFGDLIDVTVDEPPVETLEGVLADTGDRMVVPLISLRSGTRAARWFSDAHFARMIGAGARPRHVRRGRMFEGWERIVPREAFDAIIVVRETRPIRFQHLR